MVVLPPASVIFHGETPSVTGRVVPFDYGGVSNLMWDLRVVVDLFRETSSGFLGSGYLAGAETLMHPKVNLTDS